MERETARLHFTHGLTAFPPGYARKTESIATKMSNLLVNRVVPAKASMIELDRLSTRFATASPIFYPVKHELRTDGCQYLQTLKRYKHSQCSDRRDKVYGLNSLARIQPGAGIHVDYTESVYDLYFRISRLLIQDDTSGNESEVCLSVMESPNLGQPPDLVFGDEKQRTEADRCGNPESNEPSWLLPVSKEEYGKTLSPWKESVTDATKLSNSHFTAKEDYSIVSSSVTIVQNIWIPTRAP